jgi:cobalt-zinc-cadmium efflux system membrane fusion protein
MKPLVIILGVMCAWSVAAQESTANEVTCDCPSCKDLAESGKEFNLPALQGLEDPAESDHDHAEEAVPHDHDGDGKPDHDAHDVHDGHDEDGHEGHDHGPQQDPHAGHDHGAGAEGIQLTAELISKVGIEIREAEGGTLAKTAVFPAEIKLNRDRTAAVSPRYSSIVRQVFAEIGDKVRKDDVLASLENRETMAVYTLSAPQDGVIIGKDLAPGETAGDDRVLFEITDLSSVWADISIFPKYQHLVRKGMPVEFTAHDGHSTKGVVKYISPLVSHETRTFTARCILEGAGEDFTPGAFVRARITVETEDASVVVPRAAVQTIDGEKVIFVPGEQGFLPAVVTLGLADEHQVEIVSGLQPGGRYVAVGAFTLKAQMATSGMDPHAGHGH